MLLKRSQSAASRSNQNSLCQSDWRHLVGCWFAGWWKRRSNDSCTSHLIVIFGWILIDMSSQAGSVVAAGLSQGKSTTFHKDFGILRYFRDDHEKRDFVVGGASAGVAAAFGAPIGGVLFALEEAASFWNPNLILRTLVASIISSFTLNLVLSLYHGLNTFAYPGLFNLGQFEALPYSYYEIPIFMLMGCAGGLLGALWVKVNTKINIYRSKWAFNIRKLMNDSNLIATYLQILGTKMVKSGWSNSGCHINGHRRMLHDVLHKRLSPIRCRPNTSSGSIVLQRKRIQCSGCAMVSNARSNRQSTVPWSTDFTSAGHAGHFCTDLLSTIVHHIWAQRVSRHIHPDTSGRCCLGPSPVAATIHRTSDGGKHSRQKQLKQFWKVFCFPGVPSSQQICVDWRCSAIGRCYADDNQSNGHFNWNDWQCIVCVTFDLHIHLCQVDRRPFHRRHLWYTNSSIRGTWFDAAFL